MTERCGRDIPDGNPDYRVLWAKSNPRHPLCKHLLDIAVVTTTVGFTGGCPGCHITETGRRLAISVRSSSQ